MTPKTTPSEQPTLPIELEEKGRSEVDRDVSFGSDKIRPDGSGTVVVRGSDGRFFGTIQLGSDDD
jgi:hypothetical protein